MRAFWLLVLMPSLLSMSAAAEELIGDAVAGAKLAEQDCTACHVVAADQTRQPVGDAPSFFEAAADPAATALGLRAFLQTSHTTMPNLKLTPEETDNIIAYIMTLK